MIYILIISMIAVTCLFFILLKKTNYELKGLEILIYQLSFLSLFHLGKYCRFNFYQEYITIYLLVLLFGYYVFRFVKTKKGIGLDSIIFYSLIMIINSFSTTFLNKVDFFELSLSNLLIAYNIIIFAAIIIFDLIISLIKKQKNIESKNDLVILRNKISIIIVLLLIPSGIVYKYLGLYINEQKAIFKSVEYLSKEYDTEDYVLLYDDEKKSTYFYNFTFESKKAETYFLVRVDKENFDIEVDNKKCLSEQECLEKAETQVNQYLEEKYGMIISQMEYVISDTKYTYDFAFISEYTDEPFIISIDKNSLYICEDNFMLKYYSKIFDVDFENIDELNEYFSTKLEDLILKEMYDLFEIKASELVSSCDMEFYTPDDLSKEFDKNDIKSFCRVGMINDIIIQKKFNSSDKKKFIEYILNVYEYYNNTFSYPDGSSTMHFSFNYENPFYKSPNEFYKYGGYVRDAGSIYLIYLQPTPDEIKK